MNLVQSLEKIEISTNGEGFTNLTTTINSWIHSSRIYKGVIHITALHTSCSLIINENADKRVLKDLSNYFRALVPEESFYSNKNLTKPIEYSHKEEGLDDMPAHIKTSLTNTNLSLSIDDRKLVLGTWQAIYLWEHRSSKHFRTICLHCIGEKA